MVTTGCDQARLTDLQSAAFCLAGGEFHDETLGLDAIEHLLTFLVSFESTYEEVSRLVRNNRCFFKRVSCKRLLLPM
jgi:hypothetical protein